MFILNKNKDRSLKLRSNFLSKCKSLGTIIQFILFYKCYHFNLSYSFLSSVTVDFTKLLIFCDYSHSIVAGGFDVISYTILFMWSTSFTILFDTLSKISQGILVKSAVMKSVVDTARRARV